MPVLWKKGVQVAGGLFRRHEAEMVIIGVSLALYG
jgi:hypothetical protein